jgi:hypothetical protein
MQSEENELSPKEINKAKRKERLFVLFGFLVLLTWILLFVVGMFVDSAYYRIAITYGFFSWKDIALTILSFTVSNVALLAFLAALLGGICSLIIYSEGFTLTKAQLRKNNVSNILFENPFISAFRGVFLFFAVLSIQYVSSFSDIGLLGNNEEEETIKESIKDNKIYTEILKSINDTVVISKIQHIIDKQQQEEKKNENTVLINQIITYKDSILIIEENLNAQSRIKVALYENKIKGTLKKMKLEKKDQLPGISTASYFKFAIIVSLLAFLCGYDPNKFNTFLANVPFIKGQGESKINANTPAPIPGSDSNKPNP